MDEQKNDLLSPPSQPISDEDHQTETRRHGEVLVDAILQAAWDELSEFGYAHLTMGQVATRAKTNKATIYRRWSNKAKLVIAAIHKHVSSSIKGIPDTGNLSNDVVILLHKIAQPLQMIGAETLHGLMVEHLGENLMSSMPQLMHTGTEIRSTTAMIKILKNAELRGEVILEKISPRIISLPADLLRYEILISHGSISDKTINEIVNNIFMPLVNS